MISAGVPYRTHGAWDAVPFAGTYSSGAMQPPLNPTKENPHTNSTCQHHHPSLRLPVGDEEPARETSGRKEGGGGQSQLPVPHARRAAFAFPSGHTKNLGTGWGWQPPRRSAAGWERGGDACAVELP